MVSWLSINFIAPGLSAERRQAVFSLEREKAVRDLGNIFSTALILLLIMGSTYFTSTTLVKALEPAIQEADPPSPVLAIVPTPTNTPLSVTPTPTSVPATVESLEPTVTVEVTPLPLPTATSAPLVQAPVCSDLNATIVRPGSNETVSGVISVVGTATHPNFQYYKIEYAPAGTNNFAYLAGDKNPVVNGFLADIDTNSLGNGAWTLQLVVVDQTGNYPKPCQVTILVEN